MHPNEKMLLCKVPSMLMTRLPHCKVLKLVHASNFQGNLRLHSKENFAACNFNDISTDADVNHSIIL